MVDRSRNEKIRSAQLAWQTALENERLLREALRTAEQTSDQARRELKDAHDGT